MRRIWLWWLARRSGCRRTGPFGDGGVVAGLSEGFLGASGFLEQRTATDLRRFGFDLLLMLAVVLVSVGGGRSFAALGVGHLGLLGFRRIGWVRIGAGCHRGAFAQVVEEPRGGRCRLLGGVAVEVGQ